MEQCNWLTNMGDFRNLKLTMHKEQNSLPPDAQYGDILAQNRLAE
jgi:hypothetical protein